MIAAMPCLKCNCNEVVIPDVAKKVLDTKYLNISICEKCKLTKISLKAGDE